MKKIFLFYLITILSLSFAQNNLRVNNPQSWWSTGPGTIEEATISVKPLGAFIEYGLYLTFSARNTNLTNVKQLEIVLNFELPQKAVVSDLWLWVGNDIMKGIMMDKWTASQIYEDIVNRRKDPAILSKEGPKKYMLRIYPMEGKGTRKIKLTYAVPVEWGKEKMTAALPYNILQTSYNKLSKIKVLYNATNNLTNPSILEHPEIKFERVKENEMLNYLSAEVPIANNEMTANFSVDNPMINGIYLNKSNLPGNKGVYQLAFLPSKALNIPTNKKVAFLFDIDVTKTKIGKTSIINNIKSSILKYFTEKDSVNIIFSNLTPKRISDKWVSADSVSIENLFTTAKPELLANYSNLPTLLNNGMSFLNENGQDGSIFLVAASDNMGDFKLANPLIKSLQESMETSYPVHIADFNNKNKRSYSFGGRYYYGNEYFYSNLSRKTNGKYKKLGYSENTSSFLSPIFKSLTGFVSSFDMITNIETGFCYSRFNLGNNTGTIYLDQPIVQIGKFMGDMPFKVQCAGFYNSEPFVNEFTIDESSISDIDTTVEKLWAGQYIQSLEDGNKRNWNSYYQENEIINQIIDLSLENNVLSRYTALLALEPSDSVKPCLDCFDESGDHTSVEDETPTEFSLVQAYPNPFNMETKIQIKLGSKYKSGDLVTMRIYSITGEVVKTFDYKNFEGKTEFEVKWDGKNDNGEIVSSGIYIFVLKTPTEQISFKLILLK